MKNVATVIDASVAVKWFFTEADDEPYIRESDLIFKNILSGGIRAIVPSLFFSECANVFWKACTLRGYSPDAASDALKNLLSIDFETLNDAEFIGNALSIAIAYNRPVYDCLYLSVANQLKVELITADEKFYNSLSGFFPNIRWIGDV